MPQVLKGMTPSQYGSLARIRKVWPGLVGPVLAKRARPVALANGVLDVHVSSAAVRYELGTFRAEEVLESLRKQLPGVFLRTIRVRVGR